jgi:hypothetical protein
MISDSCPAPMCKKCGGQVYSYPNMFPDYRLLKIVKHDHRWTSIIIRPDTIDPNYEPDKK